MQREPQWEKKTVADVAQVVAGGTPSTQVSEFWNGTIPWITPKDMSFSVSKYVSETVSHITDLGMQKSSATLFPPQSVILSTRAPVGYLAINTCEMSSNQGIKALVCDSEKILSDFLYYYLKIHVCDLEAKSSGSTFKELSAKSLQNFEIRLPQLDEQLRIAGIHGLNLNFLSCSAIFASRSLLCLERSAREVWKSASFCRNSSSVISTYSILISKYCPAEKE